MRRYMVVGLGLLLGLTVVWAGDDGGTTETVSQPATTPTYLVLRQAEQLMSTGRLTRQRFQRAIDVSRELVGKGKEPDTKELKRDAAAMLPVDVFSRGEKVRLFPRASHVVRYLKARPWSWYYATWDVRTWDVHKRLVTVPRHWPGLKDAAVLRKLLEGDNPAAMRAMVAEALATLHRPEDVIRLGRLLDDETAAPPFLGHNRSMLSGGGPWRAMWAGAAVDGLDVYRSWRKETVAQCAKRALKLMTGKRFDDKPAFEAWWKVNRGGRNCLWYWEQRLERELEEADLSTSWFRLHQRPDETRERYRARRQALNSAARAEIHKAAAAELRRLPPEVEAKVRLLAVNRRAGGPPITGSEGQFWPDPPDLRISPDRLLDLLDRKNLWPDVPWDGDKGRHKYNLLAERLGMWAKVLFRPAHVPRLRAALKRERDNLWWSGQAGMIIGISSLLPPATEGKLDDPNTRDGVLRQAVRNERDRFVRVHCARELVRVGLPMNASFIKDVAFATRKDDEDHQMTQGILRALAQSPLTPQKSRFLVDLLLDPRFKPFWTRPDTRMDVEGIWAVNAHAGRELISNSIKNRLTIPAHSDKALAELRQLITLLRPKTGPQVKSTTSPAATHVKD